MPNNRKGLYGKKIWLRYKHGPCTYCGEPATTRDHVLPYKDLTPGATEYLVPACIECNSLLSATSAFTIEDRREIVKGKLQARYRKLLIMPTWTIEQIDELTGKLKASVEKAIKDKETLLRRLDYND